MVGLFKHPKRRLKKLLKDGEYDEAIEFGKSLESQYSDDSDFMFIMGSVFYIVDDSKKALPYFDNSKYCPVASLQKWINISKINSGPLFRRFLKGLKLSEKRLSDQTVALLIKEYLELAGIDSKNYSGHSLRSGFATSTAESGAEERYIMAMTGHKTTQMIRRYIQEANLFKNNALNKIKF